MTLRRANRIRQIGGEQVVRDMRASEAGELADSGPSEVEIRTRPHDVYLRRNGLPGTARIARTCVTSAGSTDIKARP
jgi:hypothetical protein